MEKKKGAEAYIGSRGELHCRLGGRKGKIKRTS